VPFDHNDRYHRLLLRQVPAGCRTALERARPGGTGDLPQAPVRPAAMTLGQVREQAAALLPGCAVRRLLLWRYLLVWRRPRGR
jgi:hypothetical protein